FNTPIPKAVQHPGVPAWVMMLSYQVPGTLVNSNAAAAFLLLLFPFLAHRVLRDSREARAGWFWVAGLAADVLSLHLLKSTSALIFIGAGALLLSGPRALKAFILRRPRMSAALAAIVLLACGGIVAWKFLHAYNWTGDSIAAQEATRRFSWWSAGWAMLRDHPFLGVGTGNFPSAFLAYRPGPMQNTRSAHAFWVTAAAETGLAGICAFFFSGAWLLKRLLAAPSVLEERWPLLLGSALFLGFTSFNLGVEYLANLTLLAALLGAALAPALSRGMKPGGLSLAVSAACAFAAAAFLLAPLQASRLNLRGEELLAEGDEEGALRAFSGAMSLDGLSWEARAGAARSLSARFERTRDRRDLAQAAAHQRRAVELNRLSAPLRRDLAALTAD
ncbi:MAG: O-antigen ligase family protein, partial [Elusimicrobiota bacterium]